MHLLGSQPHRIANVFRRIGNPEKAAIQLQEQVPKTRKIPKHLVGKVAALLHQLEQAINRRNPLLRDRLKDGLPEREIRAALNKAEVFGAIEPVVQLYSWRNGTAIDEPTCMADVNFFPRDMYRFVDLRTAISHFKSMNDVAIRLREMFEDTKARSMVSGMTGSLFPLFTDGATGAIAVDLKPGKGNRVVVVEFESTEPTRQAYASFADFIKDAIRVNEGGGSLSCIERHDAST